MRTVVLMVLFARNRLLHSYSVEQVETLYESSRLSACMGRTVYRRRRAGRISPVHHDKVSDSRAGRVELHPTSNP
jgi:hypothetical protein